MYQALVNQAQSEFLIAEQIHFENFIDKDLAAAAEERARYTRESARNARDAAQARLDLAQAGAFRPGGFGCPGGRSTRQ